MSLAVMSASTRQAIYILCLAIPALPASLTLGPRKYECAARLALECALRSQTPAIKVRVPEQYFVSLRTEQLLDNLIEHRKNQVGTARRFVSLLASACERKENES